jgi:hypothetical protein
MEVEEEMRTLPETVLMEGLLGQASGPHRVFSRIWYACSFGLGV